jgi:hypothetical protein
MLVVPARATERKATTSAAFDDYIRATEARMSDELRAGHFLVIDNLPETRRREAYAKLQEGRIYIEQRHAKEDGRPIHVPDGLIHDWAGVAFIPGATISKTMAVLQDYDNHQNIYKPYVRRSKLLEHDGDEFQVLLQLYQKSIVTVIVNANLDVRYTLLNGTQALSKSSSTRIAEVQNPDKPDEHELPVGNDHGYIWRLHSDWRIEEKDGGVYVQVESIALSRSIPPMLAWVIRPLIRNIPRAVLSDLLNATRKAVVDAKKSAS